MSADCFPEVRSALLDGLLVSEIHGLQSATGPSRRLCFEISCAAVVALWSHGEPACRCKQAAGIWSSTLDSQ